MHLATLFSFWAFVSFAVLRPQVVHEIQDQEDHDVDDSHGGNHGPVLTPGTVWNPREVLFAPDLGARLLILLAELSFAIVVLKEVRAVILFELGVIFPLGTQFIAAFPSLLIRLIRQNTEVLVAEPVEILIVDRVALLGSLADIGDDEPKYHVQEAGDQRLDWESDFVEEEIQKVARHRQNVGKEDYHFSESVPIKSVVVTDGDVHINVFSDSAIVLIVGLVTPCCIKGNKVDEVRDQSHGKPN